MKFNVTSETTISELFYSKYLDQVREVINKWRSSLIDDDPSVDVLQLKTFCFNRGILYFNSVIFDIMRLRKCGYVKVSIAVLARFFYEHSNLSKSFDTLYSRMRSYSKV